jgi:hypothetical protein
VHILVAWHHLMMAGLTFRVSDFRYMPTAKYCANGHLTQTQSWGSQDKILFCPTIHSDAVPMLSCGRDGAGPARAPVPRFVHAPDFMFPNSHQRPLHLFHQNTSHQSLLRILPMMLTTTRLLAIVAVWVLHECVTLPFVPPYFCMHPPLVIGTAMSLQSS